MKHIPGFSSWPNDDILLLVLIVVDNERRGQWIDVTEGDVRQACFQFELPFDKVLKIIENKDRDVHTLLIDVPKYKTHLKEQE